MRSSSTTGMTRTSTVVAAPSSPLTLARTSAACGAVGRDAVGLVRDLEDDDRADRQRQGGEDRGDDHRLGGHAVIGVPFDRLDAIADPEQQELGGDLELEHWLFLSEADDLVRRGEAEEQD